MSTPIGNLADLTERAREVLAGVSAIYAEDTRRTRVLLKAVDVDTPLRSLHEHNEARRVEEVLSRLEGGEALALVSDAGTPSISDPGRRLVSALLAAGHRVTPVPGPSAVTAALAVSGFPADRFHFLGFPPRRGREREDWRERLLAYEESCVVFEAPGRVTELLAELEAAGAGERGVVLCRELTKRFEEVRAGTVGSLRRDLEGRQVRGEVTLVLEGVPAAGPAPDRAEAERDARRWRRKGVSTRDVATRLQEAYGMSRNEAYELALAVEGGTA